MGMRLIGIQVEKTNDWSSKFGKKRFLTSKKGDDILNPKKKTPIKILVFLFSYRRMLFSMQEPLRKNRGGQEYSGCLGYNRKKRSDRNF